MSAADRLTLVAAGPGRSGADTVLRILSRHPSVAVPEGLGPPLIAAIVQLLIHAPYDNKVWLPRRAAQALTDVAHRLEAVGDHGRSAAAELTRLTNAISVDVPVYGRLLLPGQFPLEHWVRFVRQALFSIALSDRTLLALKTGVCSAPIVFSLLQPAGSLIYTVRHPVESVIGLTESAVDGMRQGEAVDYISIHLRQAKRLLSTAVSPTLLIRLEDLVSQTDSVLTELAVAIGMLDEPDWRQAARAVLPADIHCLPRWDHPAVQSHRQELAMLASSWGYS